MQGTRFTPDVRLDRLPRGVVPGQATVELSHGRDRFNDGHMAKAQQTTVAFMILESGDTGEVPE